MFKAIKKWLERRYWERRHLEYLRTTIIEDQRFLANLDPVARKIINRYALLIGPNWMYAEVEHGSDLRLIVTAHQRASLLGIMSEYDRKVIKELVTQLQANLSIEQLNSVIDAYRLASGKHQPKDW